jgi:hypothetical protein
LAPARRKRAERTEKENELRKHLIWALGLVFALASVGIASAVPNTQTIDGTITPKKLPKKGAGQAIKLKVDVSSTNSGNANQVPNPTTNAKVDFDKDIAFQQKGFPTCDTSGFGAATTVQDVRDECSDSGIGSGSATVVVPTATGAPPLTVAADVIAANVKGNKILLHSYNSLSGGQPLIGQLSKEKNGPYGTLLNVDVPPLAGGTAVITQFQTKIDKVVYKHNGKKLAIISASCSDKKIKAQARFTDNQGQLATGTVTQKCKRKGG